MKKWTIKASEKANWTQEEKNFVKALESAGIRLGEWNKMSATKQAEFLESLARLAEEVEAKKADPADEENALETETSENPAEALETETEEAPAETDTPEEENALEGENETPAEGEKKTVEPREKVLYDGRKKGTIYPKIAELWVYNPADKPAELWVYRKYVPEIDTTKYKVKDRGASKVCVTASTAESTVEMLLAHLLEIAE